MGHSLFVSNEISMNQRNGLDYPKLFNFETGNISVVRPTLSAYILYMIPGYDIHCFRLHSANENAQILDL